MAIIYDSLKKIQWLPEEDSKSKMIYSILMFDANCISTEIVKVIIFLLNICSLSVLFMEKNYNYTGIFNNPNLVALYDLGIFGFFLMFFLTKLFSSLSLTSDDIRNSSVSDTEVDPVKESSFKKLKFFISQPIQSIEFVILLLYSLVFLPVYSASSFKTILYLSFYVRCLKAGLYSIGGNIFLKIIIKGRVILFKFWLLLALLVIIFGFSAFWSEENNFVEGNSLPFNNVVNGLWWAVVTIRTIGYGEYYTQSTTGKLVSALTIIIGVLYFTIPILIFEDLLMQIISENSLKKKHFSRTKLRFVPKKRKSQVLSRMKFDPDMKDTELDLDKDYIYEYLKSKMKAIEESIVQQNSIVDGLKQLRAFVLVKLQKEKKLRKYYKSYKEKHGRNVEEIFQND